MRDGRLEHFVPSQPGTRWIADEWLEQTRTVGRHTGLHEDSVSVGASAQRGGGVVQERRGVVSRGGGRRQQQRERECVWGVQRCK